MDEPCPVAECEALDEEDRVGDGAALASLLALTGKKADDDNDDYANDNAKGRGDKGPPTAKRDGLITMSGLPPGHWKNLFHLELVKERNKPKQAPTKPPQAPFFLQWRGDADKGEDAAAVEGGESKDAAETDGKKAEEKWDAAWSDDDDVDDGEGGAKDAKDDTATKADDKEESDAIVAAPPSDKKRRKIAHHRSKLAEILQSCHDRRAATSSPGTTYDEVTRYMSKMGPSAIDVEISSLCHGIHDADDGLPLLRLAALWLLECCESRLSFEAVNAYLHRFLHVHANSIAGIEDEAAQKKEHALGGEEDEDEDDPLKRSRLELVSTIARLRAKQRAASNKLHEKMQHTICLLRHFSRMV